MIKKLILSFFLIILVQLSFVKSVDRTSSEQLDKAFTRSVTVFAIARSLNGLISVLQGTEVYATPAGVGVNFAVGQIVDPMNDMVERFSWVMLMSSVSLGVQEILLHFGQSPMVEFFLAVSVLVLLGMIWIPRLWHKQSFNLVFKAFIVFGFLRFLVPLIVLLNEGIYTYTLHDRYESAKASLETAHLQTENIVQQVRKAEIRHESSWFDTLDITQKVENFKMKMQGLWEALKHKFNSAIEYILVLISIFIVQSVLLPLFFLWLFMKLFRSFMQSDIAAIFEEYLMPTHLKR